jgi:glycerol-1-phosphate dehydrogenase [NAD(P)+]
VTRLGSLDLGAYARPTRPIGLRAVEIGPDALDRLPALLRGAATAGAGFGVAVLCDAVAKHRGGADVTELVVALASSFGDVRRVVLGDGTGGVHADGATISAAAESAAGSSVLVSVGSGTVTDIAKAVVARLRGPGHVVVQTALSVNGYADDQSVLLVDGVKRTTPTRWPDALVADTRLLADAPVGLNLAGVGDLLAMFSAPADWRLAHLLGMDDRYDEGVVEMVRPHGQALLEAAPRLGERDTDAIALVAELLTLSGIGMGVAGTTAPASGAEHTVSHLVEMAQTRRGLPTAYHGAQVGVAAVLSALVWRHVRGRANSGELRLRCPSEEEMRPAVGRAFGDLDGSGAMAEECWRDYRRKLARWRDRHAGAAHLDLAHLDDASRWLACPEDLVDALRRSGAHARICELDPPVDAGLARWALANCHLMRERFTVVDLACFLGRWEPSDVEEVLASAAAMGAGL